VRKRLARAAILVLEPAMPRPQIDDALSKLEGCQSYAIAAFASVSASRGSVGLAGDLPHAVDAIVATGKPVAFVALGNPYLLRNFPKLTAYLATFSTVPPSETAAVKALWGEIAIRGHLPVSIPEIAKIGEGLETQATRSGPAGKGSQ
jgi:beta-N-acetylhexosaminidase